MAGALVRPWPRTALVLIKTVGMTFIRGLPDDAVSHGRGGGEDVETEVRTRPASAA